MEPSDCAQDRLRAIQEETERGGVGSVSVYRCHCAAVVKLEEKDEIAWPARPVIFDART